MSPASYQTALSRDILVLFSPCLFILLYYYINCKHIFSLLDDSFTKKGREYEIIGIHWRGGEEDVAAEAEYLSQNLESIYTRIFNEFDSILGNPPIILHRLVCYDRMNEKDPTGKRLEKMNYINEVFDILQSRFENISVFDVRNAPQFVPDVRCNGLFIGDAVHFTPQVNMWVADWILKQYADISGDSAKQ